MRRTLEGTQVRPRLNVFRSGQHIYAQVIDDTTGSTLVAASSLDENLKAFKPTQREEGQTQEQGKSPSLFERVGDAMHSVVEAATEALPVKGRGARTEKAAAPARGSQQQKGAAPAKGSRPGQIPTGTVLPSAQKGSSKTPVEALAGIADNRKVAMAREVGKLVAQRAKEKGVSRVVFDRGGYTYHGRVAALAEGAREAGLDF